MKVGDLVRHKKFNWIGLILNYRTIGKYQSIVDLNVRFVMPKRDECISASYSFYTIYVSKKNLELIGE